MNNDAVEYDIKQSIPKYNVKILDKPFKEVYEGNEIISSKTAEITLFRNNEHVVLEYAYKDKTELYKSLKTENQLNLSRCYVDGFNIREYKENNKLDVYQDITIDKLAAKGSFFSNGFNLTATEVLGETINFNESFFADGIVDFGLATFNVDDVEFIGCTFINVDLRHSDTYFTGEVFYTFSQFDNCVVNYGSTKFSTSDFVFNVDMINTDVRFELVQFENSNITVCVNQQVSGNFIFSGASFLNGRYDFSNSSSCGDFGFTGCYIDGSLRIRGVRCNNLLIKDTTINGLLDLNSLESIKTSFKSINLINTIVSDKIYLDWIDQDVKKAIYNQKGTSYKEKANQFVMLKECYSSLGLYSYEDEAYVEFKRCERKSKFRNRLSNSHKQNKIIWILTLPFFLLFYFIFNVLLSDLIGKYATSPMRVFITMIFSLFLFSIAYYFLQNFDQKSFAFSKIQAAVYFSGTTFLTIGYGDISPSNNIVASIWRTNSTNII